LITEVKEALTLGGEMIETLGEERASLIGDLLTARDVADRLWLSDTNIISRMVQVGLLKPARGQHARTSKRLFASKDVEAFAQRYISLKEISRRQLFGRVSAPVRT